MNKADDQRMTTTQILSVGARRLARRRVWLPRTLYECLPFAYISTGFAAFFATLYIPEWYWVVPYYLLIACASIHAGIYIWIRRFSARFPRDVEPEANYADI